MITPAQYIRLVKEYQNNGGVVSLAARSASHTEVCAAAPGVPATSARSWQARTIQQSRRQLTDPQTNPQLVNAVAQ